MMINLLVFIEKLFDSLLQGVETKDLRESNGADDSEGETLDSVLTQLGLASFLDQFLKEQIDLDALVSHMYMKHSYVSVNCPVFLHHCCFLQIVAYEWKLDCF
jgi:hypothetical protein